MTLSAASTQTVTVAYATVNGTAIAPGDYASTAGTLTFAPGVTTQPVSVPLVTDSTVEPTETFTLTLSTPTNATIADGTGVATLTNDDVVIPAIAVNDVTMAEGTGGVATAVFTVTLSAASTQTVTVAYATVNGTAVAPGDYASTAGTLTFAPGVTTQPVSVALVTDSTVEPTETFTLTLSTPTNATIADGTGVATLTNDDVVIPTIAVNDVTRPEGTGGVATAVFTVTLSAARRRR